MTNFINPDPEQKIIELEEAVSANDLYLQELKAENARLRKALKAIKELADFNES